MRGWCDVHVPKLKPKHLSFREGTALCLGLPQSARLFIQPAQSVYVPSAILCALLEKKKKVNLFNSKMT